MIKSGLRQLSFATKTPRHKEKLSVFVARGKILPLISTSPHFIREHGLEYINLKDEEDKKTTIKTNLDSLKRDVWDDSFRKTKHPNSNLKKTKSV